MQKYIFIIFSKTTSINLEFLIRFVIIEILNNLFPKSSIVISKVFAKIASKDCSRLFKILFPLIPKNGYVKECNIGI